MSLVRSYIPTQQSPIGDNRISFGAKGVLLYLQDNDASYPVKLDDLTTHAEDISAIRGYVKELVDAGYLLPMEGTTILLDNTGL